MSSRGMLLTTVFISGLLFVYVSLMSAPTPGLVQSAAVMASNLTFPARPAAFGPSLEYYNNEDDSDLVIGPLFVVEARACSSSNGAAAGLRGSIALVLRGQCSFYDKVLNLQAAGATAVLVADSASASSSSRLLTMSARGDTHRIRIPSFFVSYSSYSSLRDIAGNDNDNGSGGDVVAIVPGPMPVSPVIDTLLFLLVSPLLSLSLIYGLLVLHRRYKQMRDRAPKALVDSLPTRVWDDNTTTTAIAAANATTPPAGAPDGPEKTWGSAAECVVCLDDYVPHVSRVMRLPCGHDFHAECITPWLTQRKRTCPICKRDVTAPAGETTPLLPSDAPDRDLILQQDLAAADNDIQELVPVASSSTSRQDLIDLHDIEPQMTTTTTTTQQSSV
ncbi:hypothetical protein V1514DRAFT_327982 [Lipomyces japonicus]|uniref:uncharacterized protein n=1 Tax=Lipomyces japonicus TaxID=56871 RepID=UPI0034CD6A83